MASLPYLFAGLQIAAPAAFLGAMVGEFTGAERGHGRPDGARDAGPRRGA
jgi:sulfonate transport system permease protein